MRPLKHIDEAIENVVKNFQISKSDLISIKNDQINNKNDQSISLLASSSTGNRFTLTSNNNSSKLNNNNNETNKSGQSSASIKKRIRKKKKKTNDFHSFETDHPFELKKKVEVKKKDNLIAGPFIRVENKKNQINYTVVNSSSRLEEKDNKLFNKPNYGSIAKSKSSNQVLFNHNDNTWICVFCKRSPHYKQLGDLYGPHELVSEKNQLDSSSQNGLASSSNALPSTSHHVNVNNLAAKNEIWFHEDCIIWSNGIYLTGNRIRNIDEVVLECSDITCCGCKLKGANLGCVHKGCNQTFHFICAKESGCELDNESFSMICQNHRSNKEISQAKSN